MNKKIKDQKINNKRFALSISKNFIKNDENFAF